MIRDLRAGTTRELAPDWVLSAESLAWSVDSTVLYALAQDAGLRARMGAAAHARFHERFTEAAVMRTATHLYAGLRNV